MDLGIAGKVAWVYGGASGLGRAAAAALAGEGVHVAISSGSEDALKEVASQIAADAGTRCIPVPLDVTSGHAVTIAARRLEAELGPVDILVTIAGGPPPGEFESTDDDALHDAFTVTTASAWRLARSVVPGMKARESGRLIFVAPSSKKEIITTLLLSNMMRAALVGMARSLSKDFGAHGVRVVCMAPGRIETKHLAQTADAAARPAGETLQEVQAAVRATVPIDHYGAPEEFGDVVAWLASERAPFINGTTVVVDPEMLNGVPG